MRVSIAGVPHAWSYSTWGGKRRNSAWGCAESIHSFFCLLISSQNSLNIYVDELAQTPAVLPSVIMPASAFSWAFMGLNQKNEALVGQSISFLAQSCTAVAVLGMIPHSCFPSLFVAVNNYLPCPFVSRDLVEIWVGLFELLNVVVFLHLSGVLWVPWSRRMKKFAGRVSTSG